MRIFDLEPRRIDAIYFTVEFPLVFQGFKLSYLKSNKSNLTMRKHIIDKTII